ncbi:thioester reductase domain-containing protein [Oleidesulfovibrio sp.]|uniref:non-ribosomal peptide synthetase family protein n=1 Tax=Oleidesulfovibrio sp. TaxID=2909707 RepID=UPI003A8C1DC2
MTGAPQEITDIFAPTPLQQGMIFHTIQAPESSEYVQQYSLHGQGSMDAHICRQAWEIVVQRHPALRTSFHWEGLEKPYQVVQAQVKLPFIHESIAHLNDEEQMQLLSRFLLDDSSKGFSLTKAPLIRIALHDLSKERFRMTMTLHHIIADGWSIGIALSEFITAYEQLVQGKRVESPCAPSLKAYARYVNTKPKEASLKWWAERLDKATPCLPLASRRKKRSANISSSFAVQSIVLSAKATEAVTRSASRAGVTLNTFFLGAWALVLARFCGKKTILTGVTVASRPACVPGIEETFGLLLNVLPLHLACPAEAPVKEWLHSIQNYLAEASEHDHLPLNSIRNLCTKPDEPFLESLAVFENMPMSEASTGHLGFSFNDVTSFDKTSYPLTLVGFPGNELRLNLQYNNDEFEGDAMLELLKAMNHAILFLTDSSEERLVDYFAPHTETYTPLTGKDSSFPAFEPWEILTSLVHNKGDETALILGDGEKETKITYQTLMERAQAIAATLQKKEVKAGDLVGLRLDTGSDLLAAMFGVWQLGAIWTPLPPSYPAEQVAKMLLRSRARCVLTVPDLWESVIDNLGTDHGLITIFTDQLRTEATHFQPLTSPKIDQSMQACMLHTSGSTGFQKGVNISYRALSNRLNWMWHELPWEPGERSCQKTSPAFVDFIWEAFGALLQGVPLVLVNSEASRNPQQLVNIIERYKVTRLIVVPSLLNAMHIATDGLQGRLQNLKYLTCSGESLSTELVNKTRSALTGIRFFNLYGSTEVVGDATWHEITTDARGSVPIGKPISNSAAIVLDENRLPLANGVEGELYIAGDCLASGYSHDTEATQLAFIPSASMPFDSQHELWFATGDRARVDEEGRICFAGRADSQCKIRGVRFNPLEVREALISHEQVLDAVVLTPEHNGQRRIAAYVQPDRLQDEQPDSLRLKLQAHLQSLIPQAIQPHAITFVQEWPTTPSGKINASALPPAFSTTCAATGIFNNAFEKQLAKIWETTLGRNVPNREADFFELGGDSLSVTQLAFNLRKSHNHQVTIKNLYGYPVLKDMASFLASDHGGAHSLPEITQAQKDITLADELKPKALDRLHPPISPGQQIFVTGAPGFIGLWILATLLERNDLNIHCMEPCRTKAEGMKALQSGLKNIGCWQASYSNRLTIVPGSLEKPQFGLSQKHWSRLTNDTDIIMHSGFQVNLAQSYTVLRPANVLGTREVLRMACSKPIPIHYVGSTSIVDFVTRSSETAAVLEDDPFTSCSGIQTGYILSRWVADHMIRRAGERGLPVSVYRMTTVGGDDRSFYCDTDEIYWRLIRVFTQTGLMPHSQRVVDLVPVDEAAKAVVALASQPESYGRAFHINSPRKLQWDAIHKFLTKAGYTITMTSPEKWAEHMRAIPPENMDENVRILLSMINDDGYDANTSLTIGCEQTTEALQRINRKINPVSEELFLGYLARMVERGWLTPPKESVQRVSCR